MELKTLKQQVEVIGGDHAQSYAIDGENMHLAIQAFYQYSDPIGSIVREITSNAYDAHIEAGVDRPILVTIDEQNNALEITDWGVGMSEELVNEVYTKFFSSTKRADNTQIGAFGLGSKSPLSYTDMFQVITKYGDTVNEYIIHKSDGVPNLVPFNRYHYDNAEGQTDEQLPWKPDQNGTKVRIGFKDKDKREVIQAVNKQLRYFDNVIVNHKDFDEFNEALIYKDEYMVYNTAMELDNGSLHVCMGKVYYPLHNLTEQGKTIDVDTLKKWFNEQATAMGKSNLLVRQAVENANKTTSWYSKSEGVTGVIKRMRDLNIGLYFEIGELPILWHRENIEFSDKVWENIFRKMFSAYLNIAYNVGQKINTLSSFYEALRFSEGEIIDNPGDVYANKKFFNTVQASVQIPELEIFGKLVSRPSLLFDSIVEMHDDCEEKKETRKALVGKIVNSTASRPYTFYRFDKGESRKPYLKSYMKNTRKDRIIVLQTDADAWFNQMQSKVNKIAPSDKPLLVKYHKQIVELVEDATLRGNDIDIPDEWDKSSDNTQSEIPILWRNMGRYKNVTYNRDDLGKGNHTQHWKLRAKEVALLVYGHQNDRPKLNNVATQNISTVYRGDFGTDTYEHKIILGIISKDTAKFINNVVPAIHVDRFLEHRRFISRHTTCYILQEYQKRYPWLKDVLDRHPSSCEQLVRGLHKHGHITDEEKRKAMKMLSKLPKLRSFSDTSFMYPYIKKAINNRYFYIDELYDLKWLHGLLAQHSTLLGSVWLKHRPDDEHCPTDRYLQQLFHTIQQHINPNLYRRYHVKYYEHRS